MCPKYRKGNKTEIKVETWRRQLVRLNKVEEIAKLVYTRKLQGARRASCPARNSESGFIHWACPSVRLFVCLSVAKIQKSDFLKN